MNSLLKKILILTLLLNSNIKTENEYSLDLTLNSKSGNNLTLNSYNNYINNNIKFNFSDLKKEKNLLDLLNLEKKHTKEHPGIGYIIENNADVLFRNTFSNIKNIKNTCEKNIALFSFLYNFKIAKIVSGKIEISFNKFYFDKKNLIENLENFNKIKDYEKYLTEKF